jgi:hypothetical protein
VRSLIPANADAQPDPGEAFGTAGCAGKFVIMLSPLKIRCSAFSERADW